MDAADTMYHQVLEQMPNNRDAMLGIAAIRIQQGKTDEARMYYARLLRLNPRDTYARAGLLQTVQSSSDPDVEIQIKNLLAQYPDSAPLSFALGNFYAANQRWNEAQQAYFDALLNARHSGIGPISPDYAFNLAVSLEQLRQPKAALNYYKQAEELARDSKPGFDPDMLKQRLAYLEHQLQ